jgi:GNAT superfamily N-acetyltransferase
MKVSTRIATDSDLPFLSEVDRHVAHSDLADVVAARRVMVAEVAGAPVGCLRWGLFWDAIPFMNLLFVLAEQRGHGVGAMLVEEWEQSQRAAGRTLVLTSTVSAETSQHLYRKLGYVDTGALFLPDEPAELILRKALG